MRTKGSRNKDSKERAYETAYRKTLLDRKIRAVNDPILAFLLKLQKHITVAIKENEVISGFVGGHDAARYRQCLAAMERMTENDMDRMYPVGTEVATVKA